MLKQKRCLGVVWDEATLERKVSEKCELTQVVESKFLTMNIV